MEKRVISTQIQEEDLVVEKSLRPQTLDEYIGQESRSFLNRFYGGNITAMLSAYMDHNGLTESEIDTLRSLLSENTENGGGTTHE